MNGKYILLLIVGVIFVIILGGWFINWNILPLSYIGENGLKHAISDIVFSLVYKAVLGGVAGGIAFTMMSVFSLKHTPKYIGNNYTKSKDINVNFNSYIIIAIIIGIIGFWIFMPSRELRFHNLEVTEDFRFANDLSLLNDIVNDLSQNKTYDIVAYKYSYIKSIAESGSRYGSSQKTETYIKFDDGNYIIITPEDKKFIEENWNEDGDNTVTLYKNSGIICKINGRSLNN